MRRLGCAERAGRHQRPWWTPTSRRPGRSDAAPLRRGNLMARARMMVLYDHSVTWRGAGGGHRQQDRDAHRLHHPVRATAPAPSTPSATSTRRQVRQLSAAIGVPDAIIRKAPSADLWPGQTDESEVGFSYAEVDRILFRLVDRRRSHRRGGGRRLRPGARGAHRPHGRGRRVQAPGAAHRQARAAHGRHRLPLPAAAAALDAWLRRLRARHGAPARSTSSRRPSATWATSRCGRSRCCARWPWWRPRTRA